MGLHHGTTIFLTISLFLSGKPLEHTALKVYIVLRSILTEVFPCFFPQLQGKCRQGQWPSRAQSSLNLCTGRPPIGVMIPETV